jgi:peptide/nickel transport system permease protein
VTAASAPTPQRGLTLEQRRLRRRFSLSARCGMVLAAACCAVGTFGPFFAPYRPDEIVGAAYQPPYPGHVFGLDYLGRDVLSRFLYGGQTALGLALAATLLGYALGLGAGLLTAYVRGGVDAWLMRANDVLMAFPALVFVLLLVSAYGSDLKLVVVAVALANAPRIARIVRAAALGVVDLPYVEAARARGERGSYVAAREILPNIKAPILVDFGIRATSSILLVAGISFLGFGLQPPAADWGLMVSENRAGLTVQPWTIVGSVAAISLLTIGINLIIDGYNRLPGGVGATERMATFR